MNERQPDSSSLIQGKNQSYEYAFSSAHVGSAKDKLGAALGWSLISAGIGLNEWVIARLFSLDGHIETRWLRTCILIIDLVFVLMGVFFIKRPRYGRKALGCVVPIVSLTACSLVIFALLEWFPFMIRFLPLSHSQYYELKSRFITDDELVFRARPLSRIESKGFKGDLYRDSYGVTATPMSFTMVFDEHGFRNRPITPPWDVVVLGDSYAMFGHDEDDTFSSRLGVLSGMKVLNLATGGHGPFQYLIALKRYGLTTRPKYVLLCFTETNDIADIKRYLQWKNQGEPYGIFTLSGKNFMQRYVMALTDAVFAPLLHIFQGTPQPPAGSLVTINLGNSPIKVVFSYRNETRRPEELLELSEWKILRNLLDEFKAISMEHDIVPMVLFFPTKEHVYAEHSARESDVNWMMIRDEQIASKEHVNAALQSLCQMLGIELIDLSPTFEQAARRGKLLYYPFDSHWNSEGRRLAASIVAERLRTGHASK